MSLRPADVPANVVAALNDGTRQTANLAEALAMDPRQLAARVLPDLAPRLDWPAKPSITKSMALVGAAVAGVDGARWRQLAGHPSDTVRGWACFAVGALPGKTLRQRLTLIRPLAADPHFGVREWAWLGVRPHVAADVRSAIKLLVPWARAKSENVRRFASEATRPRGVWCAHIAELKQDPVRARPLLDPLRADPSKYVQDSVANWLNDAGKTRPDWVRSLCEEWRQSSDAAETARIVKRALRNL